MKKSLLTRATALSLAFSAALTAAPAWADDLATWTESKEASSAWLHVKFTDTDGRSVSAWCRADACSPAVKNGGKTFPLFILTEATDPGERGPVDASIKVFKSAQLPYTGKIDVVDNKGAKTALLHVTRQGYAAPLLGSVIKENNAPEKLGAGEVLVLAPKAFQKIPASPFQALASDPTTGCYPDQLIKNYYERRDGTTPAKIRGIFAWWHPLEIEVMRSDGFAAFDASLQADFSNEKSPLTAGFANAGQEAVGGNSRAAQQFAQDKVRPRFVSSAQALAGSSDSSPARSFTKFEAPFLKCRMSYVDKLSEFEAKSQGNETPDKIGKFVRYWRAFVRSEMAVYADEAAKLPKDKPVDYKAFLAASKDRTLKALADADPAARAAMFARTKISDPDAVAANKPAGTPAGTTQDQAQAPKIVAGSDYALSADELKLLSKPESDSYVRRMAAAKRANDPAFKKGDQSQEDIVAEYRSTAVTPRDPSMNLKPEELAVFGEGSAKVKSDIEGLQGDARRAKVAQMRGVVKVFQGKRSSPGAVMSLDELKAVQADPSKADQIFTGNSSQGTFVAGNMTGPGGKTAQQIADDLNAAEKERQADKQTTATDIPTPSEDKVAASDDGGKSWKKEVPFIATGVRVGIWAGILGAFIAGPAGFFLFAVAGGLTGYGVSKLNKSLSD